MARLRAALLETKTDSAQALLYDLDTCRVDWKGRYPCRSPICSHCRWRYIRAQQIETREFFADSGNSDLGLLTVVLGATDHLDGIEDITGKAYRGTRNRINAGRRGRNSMWWNLAAIKGWYEIDAFGVEHIPSLGSKRRALLGGIAPCSMSQTGPIWVPTFHAIVKFGGLGIGEVREAFERQWPVPGQTHLVPFRADRAVENNLDRVASYANKHACTIQLGGVYERWPVSWIADLYSWLHVKRNAFEFMRFSVGEKVLHVVDDSIDHSSIEVDPLPFDVSFNTFPMPYRLSPPI